MKIRLNNAEVANVVAMEHNSESPDTYFWTLDHSYMIRQSELLFYPTLITDKSCDVVDGKIPNDWYFKRYARANSHSRTIIGPIAFIEFSFLEKLVDGDAVTVLKFKETLTAMGYLR